MMKKIYFLVMLLLVAVSNVVAQTYSGGDGTETSPYLISSKADMETLATTVNSGTTYSGKYFLLTQNLEGITTVIGGNINNFIRPFSGAFDGGGHIIDVNINISSSQGYAGIFGYSGSTIKNLGVTGNISSSYYAGGICGYSSGKIINCYNNGTVSITFATMTASNYYVGGICGDTHGEIVNCYNKGDVSSSISTTSSSFAFSGGICGHALSSAKITNCYNKGNIYATTTLSNNSYAGGICGYLNGNQSIISNSFSANTVIINSNSSSSGRILGYHPNGYGEVKNCYALSSMTINGSVLSDTENNANGNNGNGVALSSFYSQSWIEETLHWDFNDIWRMAGGANFPILKLFSMDDNTILTLDEIPTVSYGDIITLSATTNNQTTAIVYKSSDNTIAEIIGNLLIAKKAGNVTITAVQASGNGYFAGENTVDLYIQKAPLTISANNVSRKQGETNPAFTLSYSGFRNNDNASVLDILPAIYCAAYNNSPVGFYDIILSGGSDKNYTYNFIYGKLEVTPATGINDVDIHNISVYPNPAKQDLFIKSYTPIEKVEIYNLSGQVVLTDDNFVEKIDVSHLSDGIYFVRVAVDGTAVTKKVIVKK